MKRHKSTIPNHFRLNNHGFTLVELLVAIAVSSIVLIGIYSVFRAQQNSYYSNTQSVQIQQNLRAALYMMERDIRLAGYSRSGDLCATIIGARLGEINFTLDDDDNGSCEGTTITGAVGANPREDLAYGMRPAVDANRDGVPDTGIAVGTIGRRIGGPNSIPGFQPIAGNVERIAFGYAFDDDQDGEVDLSGGEIIWAYDSDGDGDLDRIRMVRIWAVARSTKGLQNYGGTRTFMSDPITVTYDPATDKPASPYTTTDNFMRREMDAIIKCRNMGLRISTS